MIQIKRATPDQAERLFEIMVQATEIDCARSYPPEIIAIWHKGCSAEGFAIAIADDYIYSLHDGDAIRGFVHIGDSEILGLFVHPENHRQGYGTDLFRFAEDKIAVRPIMVKATLNALPFYTKLGFIELSMESVRRYDHDIYVVLMELT